MTLQKTKTEKPASPEKTDKNDANPTRNEKNRALETAVGEIEKAYGKGSIMRLGDAQIAREIRGIPTGSISLDLALGGRGLPRGRVVEIYGPESSGKTTLTLHVVANA